MRKVEETEEETKLNRTQNFLVLDENVYLFSKNINTTKENTGTQTYYAGLSRLEVNAEKIKVMLRSCLVIRILDFSTLR
jgi:hypothetical protein